MSGVRHSFWAVLPVKSRGANRIGLHPDLHLCTAMIYENPPDTAIGKTHKDTVNISRKASKYKALHQNERKYTAMIKVLFVCHGRIYWPW